MALWELLTSPTPYPTYTTPGGQQMTGRAGVYRHYFGRPSFTPSTKDQVRNNIREAENHGMVIPRAERQAIMALSLHGNEWFTPDGTLREGLSRREARKALEARRIASAYSEAILPGNNASPKTKKKELTEEQKQGRWALENFIKVGYDVDAAKEFAKVTDFTQLATLWGGDVAKSLKNGLYGDDAEIAEKNFYSRLSAPQKKAYLNQRSVWISKGIIQTANNKSLNNLGEVSDQEMKDYAANNIETWWQSFYGQNGYQDEYAQTHREDSENSDAYDLYGLSSTQKSGTWMPPSLVNTSMNQVPTITPAKPKGKTETGKGKGKGKGNGNGNGNGNGTKKGTNLTQASKNSTGKGFIQHADGSFSAK